MSENLHFKKGLELFSQKKFSDAILCFSEALKSEENPRIYYERALAYYHNNDIVLALKDLNIAQELDPQNPFRYSSRAFIKDKMGDTNGAISDYKKTIQLDPEDAIAHNNLGLLEEKLGFEETSKQHFHAADNLLKQNPDFFNANNGNGNVNNPTETFFQNGIQETAEQKFSAEEYLKEIYKVFTQKSSFREFLQFIKKRFR